MDSLVIFCAKYLIALILLITLAVWWQATKKDKYKLVLTIALAGVLAVILDKIAAKLYYDPRPFATHHIKPLVSHAADNGFPSEHTILTVTLSTIVVFYRRRLGILSFGLALIVGSARVAAHVHSPIDIFGAAAIGLVAGFVGFWAARYILANYPKKRDNTQKPAAPVK